MGLLFESWYTDFLVLTIGFFSLVYWFFTSNFNYWEKRGIPYLKPTPFLGNMRQFTTFKKSFGEELEEHYHEFGDHKFGGIFQIRMPILVLKDPEIIKHFMTKDFQHFQDRGIKFNAKANPLAQHLFSLSGQTWRILRTKLSPTFTSGKMKMMFQLMDECAVQLKDYLSVPASKGEILELKDVLGKFSTDVIGTCAFGLQFNSMANPDSVFRKMGKKIFEPSIISTVRRMALMAAPFLIKWFNISVIGKDVSDFFLSAVKDTVEYREKNNVVRNDFLQLLIQLKNKGKLEDDHESSKVQNESNETHTNGRDPLENFELSDEMLAAQCFVFFLAGFETSSTTMSFALHELAVNPDIQSRLRQEIDSALEKSGGKVTYEMIQNMPYLDKVIAESLRKYPPVATLLRTCTIPYTIPGSTAKVDKDTRVMIPVFALHRDPKYYPDPDKFDPERFSEENKSKRHHYTYLPFGEGPRICIGMRFGLLQTKIGLITLLSNYEFQVCENTQIPLKFDTRSAVTASTTGTILRITNRV